MKLQILFWNRRDLPGLGNTRGQCTYVWKGTRIWRWGNNGGGDWERDMVKIGKSWKAFLGDFSARREEDKSLLTCIFQKCSGLTEFYFHGNLFPFKITPI